MFASVIAFSTVFSITLILLFRNIKKFRHFSSNTLREDGGGGECYGERKERGDRGMEGERFGGGGGGGGGV